ncbi:MAG: hypothetical protein JXB38_02380 [Anaerolineales bacterium]|nr:hypothetical protein [Anaerolineales bacterium]
MQFSWKRTLRSFSSAVIFAAVVAFIFQSWELGVVLTGVLALHEFGHAWAVSQFGIEWDLRFCAAGAYTVTPARERATLNQVANAFIHLAGPLANLALAMLAVLLNLLTKGDVADFFGRLANLSALICLLNALPFWGYSDGSRFLKRLYASLEEKVELRYLWPVIIWPLPLVWAFIVTRTDLLGALSVVLIGGWMVLHMVLESGRDDPADAYTPMAMTRQESALMLLLLMLILTLATLISLLTPFWVTEAHVVKMIYGLAGIFIYIFFRSSLLVRALILIVLGIGAYLLGRALRQRRLNRNEALQGLTQTDE